MIAYRDGCDLRGVCGNDDTNQTLAGLEFGEHNNNNIGMMFGRGYFSVSFSRMDSIWMSKMIYWTCMTVQTMFSSSRNDATSRRRSVYTQTTSISRSHNNEWCYRVARVLTRVRTFNRVSGIPRNARIIGARYVLTDRPSRVTCRLSVIAKSYSVPRTGNHSWQSLDRVPFNGSGTFSKRLLSYSVSVPLTSTLVDDTQTHALLVHHDINFYET